MDSVQSFHSKTVHAIMEPDESIGGLYDVTTADIYFLCVDDETLMVPAHKAILAADSPVFHGIFYDEVSEQVLLDDCRIETLSIFLRSFYCDVFEIGRDTIVEVTQMAEKYVAEKCKSACWRFLGQMIQTAHEDIFMVLDLAITYQNMTMQNNCVKKLMHVGHLLIETKAFVSCSQQVLEIILGSAFSKRDEVKMFIACIEWAKHQCKLKKLDSNNAKNLQFVLSNSFALIQFHKMTPVQFIKCQNLHADIFSVDDLKRISTDIIAAHPEPEPENESEATQESLMRQFIKTSFNANGNVYKTIESMFGDSKTSNVFFAFDSIDEEVHWIFAHKCILAAKSPVFKNLFYSDQEQVTDNYPISDTTLDEFNAFIQTFYYKSSDGILNEDNILKMITLANSYEVNGLLDECITFAIKSLCFENVFMVLNACFLYSNADSVSACLGWIIANEGDMNRAFHRYSLIDCDYKTVEFALGLDIPNRQERQIFKASIEWARKLCEKNQVASTVDNLKNALGNAFNLIRFASMKPEDFFDSPFNLEVMFHDTHIDVTSDNSMNCIDEEIA